MDNDYLDFGSDSDSDSDGEDMEMRAAVKEEMEDSDDDEKDDALVQLLSLPTSKKTQDKINMEDFEAEMEAELDKRAMEAEKEGGMEHQKSLSRSSSSSSLSAIGGRPTSSKQDRPASSVGSGSSDHVKVALKKSVHFAGEPPPPGTTETESKEVYDAIYFDSDESEGEDDEKKARKRSKRECLSNDDLFYDPNSDAADQEWVDNKRRDYCNPTLSSKNSKGKKGTETKKGSSEKPTPSEKSCLRSTDAVLNCPACFTALCLDCQRHEYYSGQYRAMFVMNCVTDKTETLIVPVKEPKSKRRDKSKAIKLKSEGTSGASLSESDKFFPVKCRICTTQVAVFDHDEVYHFFNVLASHP